MTSPAMGTITFSLRVCIMENIFAFHPCGVCPTSAAIVPTFSFTSPNIVDRLPFMAPMRISFIHSLIASSMLCISLYPRFLTEQPGKQRYKGHADKGNAAARHELLHPFCSRRGANPARFHLEKGEHPMLSHGRRLYLHPPYAGQTASGRLPLLLQRIVVGRSPVRGFAADCPL